MTLRKMSISLSSFKILTLLEEGTGGYWRVLEGTDGRKEEGKGGKKFSYLASLKSLVCSYLGWML